MMLEAQTAHAREAAHRAIMEESKKFRNCGTIEIKFPASMACARKG
jgi:hypothetical protein